MGLFFPFLFCFKEIKDTQKKGWGESRGTISVLSLAGISEVLCVCRGCMGNMKKSIGLHFCKGEN